MRRDMGRGRETAVGEEGFLSGLIKENAMSNEAKLLLEKACDSLVLSVELFNRPSDRGRVNATLIHLDHCFEMFMKAAILARGGAIVDGKRVDMTIGFDTCVRVSLSNGMVKYLTEEQATTLRAINALRDFAQHHLLDISEHQLYIHVQSGVTLFGKLLKEVFDQELGSYLPTRVLPISTTPPTTIEALFITEIAEIKKLLHPGQPIGIDALAKLRPLAVLDRTVRGQEFQLSNHQLQRYADDIEKGKDWQKIFIGVAMLDTSPSGEGPALPLTISKKEGIPVQNVPEGTPGATLIATRRVSELDFYNMGAKKVGEKLGLSTNKVVAVVEYLGIRNNPDCYKEIKIDGSLHKRYSQKVLSAIQNAIANDGMEKIWNWDSQRRRRKRAKFPS